ncbi:hypothetical protein Nepgr_014239 [Nepenthes gracilis]|uniref:Transmembrane protein n=1 Tax=Nepenthes gracilis TaxID=150966 RepID=A0AAD3SJM4_NEPGR|nr:hypothetical protein Nepgr_014239 [Nepenthes gracilis]
MEPADTTRRIGRLSGYGRPAALLLTLLAVISPLYIDQRRAAIRQESEGQPLNFVSFPPLLLVVLIMAIAFSCYIGQNYWRFDPYWIHRVGGSSGGIATILMILVLILSCKASIRIC